MNTRFAVFGTAALILGACEQEPAVEARNASVSEVADQVREAGNGDEFIQPGRWVSKVSFEEITAPGMPPQVLRQMRAMMGDGRQYESCLTPEEAQRPREDFFARNSDQCRYEHFTMRSGEIEAEMRCSQGDITQVMQMDGSYSPDSYEIAMTTSLEGAPDPAGQMRMQMRVEAQRTGECDGTES